jgi:homospermidine synthase
MEKSGTTQIVTIVVTTQKFQHRSDFEHKNCKRKGKQKLHSQVGVAQIHIQRRVADGKKRSKFVSGVKKKLIVLVVSKNYHFL